MANYALSGFTPPADVKSREDVKVYQKRLGVTEDGVWGPKTQAAYEKTEGTSASGATAPQSYADYYTLAMSYARPQTVSAGSFSTETLKKELQGFMRPAVDTSIARRKEAAQAANAELDADAFSRGMGGSTYISSMKEREDDDVQRDITELEAQYSAALSEKLYDAINDYQTRAFAAQTFNAQQNAAAQNTAAELASTWYTAAKTPQKRASSGSRGAKKNTTDLSITEIYDLMEMLDETERYDLFNGETAYWTIAREELINSVSPEIYKKLQQEFEPALKVKLPAAGGAGIVTNRRE